MAASKKVAPAKGKVPVVVHEVLDDELDDLLGEGNSEKSLMDLAEEGRLDEVEEEVDRKRRLKNEEKARKKAEKEKDKPAKEPRQLKGVMVSFNKGKTGEKVVGHGTLYYVVRHNGKLYYKEASACEVLEHEDVDVPLPNKD